MADADISFYDFFSSKAVIASKVPKKMNLEPIRHESYRICELTLTSVNQ